jgi:hypothetical protein
MQHTKLSTALFTALAAYYPFIWILLWISVTENGNRPATYSGSLADFLNMSEGFKL